LLKKETKKKKCCFFFLELLKFRNDREETNNIEKKKIYSIENLQSLGSFLCEILNRTSIMRARGKNEF
jgi:hypothetical protein